MKKILAFLALLIAAPAFGQLTPVLAYCMNPSGVSIVLNGLGGVAAGFTPGTDVQLYGQTAGGVITAVQCDAGGNLILASLPQNATDPATCATGQVEFNTTANVPKYCYPANTWNSWNGGSAGTVTGSGTTNYYPLWSGTSSLTNSTIDHGVTTAGTDTDSYNFAAPQITVTGNCTLTSTAIGCPQYAQGTPPTAGTSGFNTLSGSSGGLGQNIGTGAWVAFLYNGGPGGTPSSLTLTNATGLPTAGLLSNAVTLAKLATQNANTVLANVTGSAAVPTAATIPSGIQNYVAGTGYNQATGHQLQVPLACPDSSGSGTAQSCSTGGTTYTPAAPDCVIYTTTTTNSGTGLTTNINSLGAASIAIPGASGWTTTLTASIIPANKPQLLCYDGTNWDDMQTGTAAAGSGGSGGGTSGWSGLPLTLATTATQYTPPVGGGATSATESVADVGFPAAATISNLYVSLSASLGTGTTLAVTLRDAGVSRALTCTTASGGTSCSDTTHSFNVAKGDLVDFLIVATGTVTSGLPTIVINYAVGTSSVGVTSVSNSDGSIGVATGTTTPVVSCTTATTSQLGCVKPDGSTITISSGVISASGSTSPLTYWTAPLFGVTTTSLSGAADRIAGYAFTTPAAGLTFSNMYFVSAVADATAESNAAIVTTAGAPVCYGASASAIPATNSTWTVACTEGTVTLPGNTIYILLTTSHVTTGKLSGANAYTATGPFYNGNVTGCTASSGAFNFGTNCSITLAAGTGYAAGFPNFSVH